MKTKEEYIKSEIYQCECNIDNMLERQKIGVKEEFKNDPIAIEESKKAVESYVDSQKEKIEFLTTLSDDEYNYIINEKKLDELFERIAINHNTTVEELDKLEENEFNDFFTKEELIEIINLIEEQ